MLRLSSLMLIAVGLALFIPLQHRERFWLLALIGCVLTLWGCLLYCWWLLDS